MTRVSDYFCVLFCFKTLMNLTEALTTSMFSGNPFLYQNIHEFNGGVNDIDV